MVASRLTKMANDKGANFVPWGIPPWGDAGDDNDFPTLAFSAVGNLWVSQFWLLKTGTKLTMNWRPLTLTAFGAILILEIRESTTLYRLKTPHCCPHRAASFSTLGYLFVSRPHCGESLQHEFIIYDEYTWTCELVLWLFVEYISWWDGKRSKGVYLFMQREAFEGIELK